MELSGVIASLPIIGTIVGVVSGTISLVLLGVRGYRHLRQRLTRTTPAAALPLSPGVSSGSSHEKNSAPAIRTPDQRLRVFVSSTLQELAPERAAVRQAIARLRLSPVMFEIGARPHPPREVYRAYLAQSDVFIGIYWQKYGWIAPGEDVSGLEDEYRLCGDKPKLIYIKTPAPDREPQLTQLLDQVRADDHVSYKSFRTAAELRRLVSDDLALLVTERFVFASSRTSLPELETAATGTVGADRKAVPLQTTSFVGRDVELSQVRALVGRTRVITLTGPGGVGKTRLALQVASELADNYAGGVCVVDLAALLQSELVPQAIADALDVREEPGRALLDTLEAGLESRHLLLVLDNCERVVEGCARTVDRLVHACPKIDVLA